MSFCKITIYKKKNIVKTHPSSETEKNNKDVFFSNKMDPSIVNIINTGKIVKIRFISELEKIINKNYSDHNKIIEDIKNMNPIYDYFKSEINLSKNPVLIYTDIKNYIYINKITTNYINKETEIHDSKIPESTTIISEEILVVD